MSRAADDMTPRGGSAFPVGVIEGFYGPPWSAAERLQLFDWMAPWGLNTYLYAPKDDLHHRAIWREPYPADGEARMRELVSACSERGVEFVYALGPGLDIRYGLASDLERLLDRVAQMRRIGCTGFALLFDDIPGEIEPSDVARWGSLAGAQAHVVNAVFARVRERHPETRFFFCPTPYCGRMAAAGLGGPGYLETIGRTLHEEIAVFWTGPEIVSPEITVPHVRGIGETLRRRPVIWDNLHANDYDTSRCFCGPYAGRPLALLDEVAGILTNPNVELPVNYVPLRTFAAFARRPAAWDPRGAYLEAMREWIAAFRTVGAEIAVEDLILFGDAFYLPYEEGPEAEAMYADARRMVQSGGTAAVESFRVRGDRLRAFCGAVAGLRDRALFHALNRRVWALREELDLLERFAGRTDYAPVTSDFHRPGTYRGGLVARLQGLTVLRPDGTFVPAPEAAADARMAAKRDV